MTNLPRPVLIDIRVSSLIRHSEIRHSTFQQLTLPPLLGLRVPSDAAEQAEFDYAGV
jgi:hypothetical protein